MILQDWKQLHELVEEFILYTRDETFIVVEGVEDNWESFLNFDEVAAFLRAENDLIKCVVDVTPVVLNAFVVGRAMSYEIV